MKNNGWILASDRLPEKEGEEVLLYLKGDYYEVGCVFNGFLDIYHIDDVIAWKPIEKFEIKKVKKTIHYPVIKQYKQDVLVDNNMSDDEIIDLWLNDDLKTLNGPVPDDDYNDEDGTWVE